MWFPVDATKMPLTLGATQRAITPNLIVLHTNGGGGSVTGLWDYWENSQSGIFSHFQVDANGKAAQYQSTDLEAPAQFAANSRAVSIETQDGGDPNTPWSVQQIAAISNIIRGVAQYHNIPLRLVTSDAEAGIGYHQQFPAWNQSAHNCPGSVRVHQLSALVASLTSEDDMAMSVQDWKDMGALADKIITHSRDEMFAVVKAIKAELDGVKADVAAIKTAGGYGK